MVDTPQATERVLVTMAGPLSGEFLIRDQACNRIQVHKLTKAERVLLGTASEAFFVAYWSDVTGWVLLSPATPWERKA